MNLFPPSPRPLIIYHKRRFDFFRKFSEIFTARCLPPVSLTPVTNGKIFNQKMFHRFHWYRWQICRRCRWCRRQFCRQCHWHRWQICHWCRWYRWCTLTCEYLHEFLKKFETLLMEYTGAGGKMIHVRNQKQKISWHCPFKGTNARDDFSYFVLLNPFIFISGSSGGCAAHPVVCNSLLQIVMAVWRIFLKIGICWVGCGSPQLPIMAVWYALTLKQGAKQPFLSSAGCHTRPDHSAE